MAHVVGRQQTLGRPAAGSPSGGLGGRRRGIRGTAWGGAARCRRDRRRGPQDRNPSPRAGRARTPLRPQVRPGQCYAARRQARMAAASPRYDLELGFQKSPDRTTGGRKPRRKLGHQPVHDRTPPSCLPIAFFSRAGTGDDRPAAVNPGPAGPGDSSRICSASVLSSTTPAGCSADRSPRRRCTRPGGPSPLIACRTRCTATSCAGAAASGRRYSRWSGTAMGGRSPPDGWWRSRTAR